MRESLKGRKFIFFFTAVVVVVASSSLIAPIKIKQKRLTLQRDVPVCTEEFNVIYEQYL